MQNIEPATFGNWANIRYSPIMFLTRAEFSPRSAAVSLVSMQNKSQFIMYLTQLVESIGSDGSVGK